MEHELGNAYKWYPPHDHRGEVRAQLIKEAEAKLPAGTRYELRFERLKYYGKPYEEGMCWFRAASMDTDPDWTEGLSSTPSGIEIERRTATALGALDLAGAQQLDQGTEP